MTSPERAALVRKHRRYQVLVGAGALVAAVGAVAALVGDLPVGAALYGVAAVSLVVACVRGYPGYHRALAELDRPDGG